MDYLDPHKEKRHQILLFCGYILITIAIVLTSLVLFYQSYGFGVNRNGDVIQNGLAFFSSQPSGATISIDGNARDTTAARLILSAGQHRVEVLRSGYRTWAHDIVIYEGGVQHFDYPFLVPETLTTVKAHDYDSAPPLATQSLNRRWLLVQQPGSTKDFLLYDLTNTAIEPVAITLPDAILTQLDAEAQSFSLVSWADDNVHVLLKRIYGESSEYILLNREKPVESLNLSTRYALTDSELTLHDRKYDKYLIFGQTDGKLQAATLRDTTLQPVLENVINFKSYASDTYLYATAAGAPTGQVSVKMLAGDKTYTLRNFSASNAYLLDYATYSRVPYAIMADTADQKVYVYRDPIAQLRQDPKRAIVPQSVLRIPQPDKLVFSQNAQFIAAFHGSTVALHDIETKHDYKYNLALPLDAGSQPVWMDGNRLGYVSGGKQVFVEFDNANPRQLVASLPQYQAFYSPTFEQLYTFSSNPRGAGVLLNRTSMLATP